MTTSDPCTICNEVHDPTKCQGHSKHGGGHQCKSPPHSGDTDRCFWHGGRPKIGVAGEMRRPANRDTLAPVVAKGRAAAADTPLIPGGRLAYDPLWNPLEELQDLAGRMKAWMLFLETKVAELRQIRYTTDGGEALRSEISLYERAMERLGSLLMGIARLNIDERLVRIAEAQKDVVLAAIEAALSSADLTEDQASQARTAAARHLRVVADPQPAITAA